jgi:acetyl-CoA acetyltransferase
MVGTHPLRGKAAIVGVGESEIGKVPHMTGLGLAAQAAKQAIDEAGLKPSDIDGLLTAYSMTEPYFMLGSVMAEYLGLKPTYGSSMVSGGATPAVMVSHAAQAVASGMAKNVLVVIGENRATGQTRDQAVQALAAVGHPYLESPYGPLIPGFYGMIANRYMHEFGTKREEMAAVSVNTRHHATLHPNAHMKKPITVDDVLTSKTIASPLNLLDCCLISDAGGAVIVTSAERARDMPKQPVYILGLGESHTHEHAFAAESLTEFGSKISAANAFAMAGLAPKEMDFAELYDCFSIVPIIELEEIGFAPIGEGGHWFASGRCRYDGAFPVNTHGGLLSHAHAGAAGGLFGFVEAVRQLRGEAGRRQVANHERAFVHNEGGIMSSHASAVLSTGL